MNAVTSRPTEGVRQARRDILAAYRIGTAFVMLAVWLGVMAGGGALLWHQGGRLTDNDATLQQKIAEDPVPRGDGNPFGPRVRSGDDARLDAFMTYNFGLLILLMGGAGVVIWCGETRNAFSRLRSTGKA